MALVDSVLNIFTKQSKDGGSSYEQLKPSSRSEREAKIKDKAGLVINVFALLLAVNTWYGGKLSSTILNNTIAANDTYAFYQAKSLKKTMAEYAADDAAARSDKKRADELRAKADRYQNEPKEGMTDLLAKAQKLEHERDEAKLRSPWIGYANTAYQLAIVLLSASILAVSMPLFWGSFGVAAIGLLLSSQGVLLWL